MSEVHPDKPIEQQDQVSETFEALYAKYYQPGVRFVRRRFPEFAEEAEDLVQAAFLRIWEQQRWYQVDYDPRSVVYHEIYCEAVAVYRHRHANTSPPMVLSADLASEEHPTNGFPDWIASPLPSVEQQVILAEELRTLEQAMIGLPADQRLVAQLMGHGVSFEEINEALQAAFPVQCFTLQHLVVRSRATLREALERAKTPKAQYYKRRNINRQGKWSKVAEACVQCGTRTIPHTSQGLCHRCYTRAHSAKYRAVQSERRRQRRQEKQAALQSRQCQECGAVGRLRARGLCRRCYNRLLKRERRAAKRAAGKVLVHV
jgi:RNA polymerase sigma factor (sigma-70 family)